MPALTEHQSTKIIKLLLVGDPGTGKTSALASLVKAGYRLRIMDFDNLLTPLVRRLSAEERKLVSFVPFRDKLVGTDAGMMVQGTPKALTEASKMLNRWKDATEDLGNPAEWGDKCIVVLDSLSRARDAAMAWGDFITPSGKGGKDGRAIVGEAQRAITPILQTLTADAFRTNVIVIAHGTYLDLPDGTKKIYPQGVGQKLTPKIPQYFPNYIRYKNKNGKRTIQLESDSMIDLANTRPGFLNKELDISTGLAEFFGALRDGAPKEGETPKPKSVTLVRKS